MIRKNAMRKTILLGTTAVALALGAANAYAMGGGPLSPEASPYAILEPQTVAPSMMSEGRAALTGGDPSFWSGQTDTAAPLATPEERNYFSRGR
jgi:hypothetical protein